MYDSAKTHTYIYIVHTHTLFDQHPGLVCSTVISSTVRVAIG